MAKYPIHKTTNVTGSYYKTRHADSIVENIDKLVDKLKAKDGWENVDENDIITYVIDNITYQNNRNFKAHNESIAYRFDDPRDSKWRAYTPEEILAMADSGSNVPKDVYEWAKSQVNSSIDGYTLDTGIVTEGDSTNTDADSGISKRSQDQKEALQQYALKAQAQDKLLNDEGTELIRRNDELEDKENDLVLAQRESKDKIKSYKEKIDRINEKVQRGEELTDTEKATYNKMAELIKNESKNIIIDAESIENDLESLANDMDDMSATIEVNNELKYKIKDIGKTYRYNETQNAKHLPIEKVNMLSPELENKVYAAVIGNLQLNSFDKAIDLDLASAKVKNNNEEANYLSGEIEQSVNTIVTQNVNSTEIENNFNASTKETEQENSEEKSEENLTNEDNTTAIAEQENQPSVDNKAAAQENDEISTPLETPENKNSEISAQTNPITNAENDEMSADNISFASIFEEGFEEENPIGNTTEVEEESSISDTRNLPEEVDKKDNIEAKEEEQQQQDLSAENKTRAMNSQGVTELDTQKAEEENDTAVETTRTADASSTKAESDLISDTNETATITNTLETNENNIKSLKTNLSSIHAKLAKMNRDIEQTNREINTITREENNTTTTSNTIYSESDITNKEQNIENIASEMQKAGNEAEQNTQQIKTTQTDSNTNAKQQTGNSQLKISEENCIKNNNLSDADEQKTNEQKMADSDSKFGKLKTNTNIQTEFALPKDVAKTILDVGSSGEDSSKMAAQSIKLAHSNLTGAAADGSGIIPEMKESSENINTANKSVESSANETQTDTLNIQNELQRNQNATENNEAENYTASQNDETKEEKTNAEIDNAKPTISDESREIQETANSEISISDGDVEEAIETAPQEPQNITPTSENSIESSITDATLSSFNNPLIPDTNSRNRAAAEDVARATLKELAAQEPVKESAKVIFKNDVAEVMKSTLSGVSKREQQKDTDRDKKHKILTQFENLKRSEARKTVQKVNKARDVR